MFPDEPELVIPLEPEPIPPVPSPGSKTTFPPHPPNSASTAPNTTAAPQFRRASTLKKLSESLIVQASIASPQSATNSPNHFPSSFSNPVRFIKNAPPVLPLLFSLLQITPDSPAIQTAQPAPANTPACPNDMLLVQGEHYENVERFCTDYHGLRCWSFLPGLMAQEPRVTSISVCMDRYEWPNRAGKTPQVMVRFIEAEELCAAAGKRLCSEFEWETACEGPETRPWPYGFSYDPKVCNTAKPYLPVSEAKLNSREKKVRQTETWRVWQGAPSGAFPACISSHGVVDLVGNVEEWVKTDRPEWPYRSSLKGGFWAKPGAACRGTNDSHGPSFRFYEVGFRCCKDPA